MEGTFKIIRYTVAALMAGASFILNAHAATLQENHAGSDVVVSKAFIKNSEEALPF